MNKLDKLNKLVTIVQINLPQELIKELRKYLYYTPEQIATRELYKRVHYSIKNARHYYSDDNYLFSYKFTLIYICFCKKCGNYKFSSDMEDCVLCRC